MTGSTVESMRWLEVYISKRMKVMVTERAGPVKSTGTAWVMLLEPVRKEDKSLRLILGIPLSWHESKAVKTKISGKRAGNSIHSAQDTEKMRHSDGLGGVHGHKSVDSSRFKVTTGDKYSAHRSTVERDIWSYGAGWPAAVPVPTRG